MVKSLKQLQKQNEIVVSYSKLKEYQSKSAIREVLGCLIKNPQLLKSYKLAINDFVDVFHQIIFVSIFNMAREGIQRLDGVEIEKYLQEYFPNKYLIFNKHNGLKYCQDTSIMSNLENFEANYNEVKKWSLLRELLGVGIDVSEYYEPDLEDPDLVEYKAELFKSSSVDDILQFYRNKMLKISNIFNTRNGRDSVKAGSNESYLQKEKWKEQPDHGLSYASNYLTTVTMGLRPKRYTVMSAGTGVGKVKMPC